MDKIDARKLSAQSQEDLRRRVVRAVRNGMKKKEAARFFEVSYYSVRKWVKVYQRSGVQGLKAKRQGRPKKSGKLKGWQAGKIAWTVINRCPDEVELPFTLWNRNAIRQLIKQRYGIEMSLAGMSRLLKKWQFTPQKPIYRAIERNPKQITQWLQEDYPEIKKESATRRGGDTLGR